MNARTAVFVLVALTVAVIALSTGTTVYYLLAIMPAMMAILSLASVLLTPPPRRESAFPAATAWASA